MSSSPFKPPAAAAAEQRRHDIGTILATLRLGTQLLQRRAQQQDGDG